MENKNIQLPFITSHAFIIGINDYKQVSRLTTAVNDANALAEQLEKNHGYQVHGPLLNATKADILQLLKEDFSKLVQAKDRVLFYFAGHGIALNSDDNPKGYLVPADAQPGDADSLISMDLLHEKITALPCQHGMLIMDCCFAGAFKWSTGFRDVVFDLPGIIYEERFYQYAQDPAWQVITSSASDQKAVDILADRTLGLRAESGAKHSPFALALLEGLAGEADTVPKNGGDGVITATELYTYLRDRVEDETTDQGKRQSPSMFSLQKHDKGQYIFTVPNHRLNLPPIPKRNPFMGLSSYNEKDSYLFYGRDRAIETLDELIESNPLVVVSGASGTGKSSVIKAGLLPLLRKKNWQILPVVRPGKEPIKSLRLDLPDLEAQMKEEKSTLLIVDQYEELITQCLHPDERIQFEKQLAKWIKKFPQLHIAISIRSDFEPQFENATLKAWWQKGRYVVPVFSQDDLREVIIKPTIQEVLFFEPDSLVDKLVDAVNQAPGALPLLSFTLSELYHAYLNSGRTNRAFTLEDYEKLGGVIGALRTRANAIYDEMDQAHQSSMRKLMLRMVSMVGGELASRRVFSEELIFSDASETKRIKGIAQQLIEARLISSGTDQQDRTYFEPAHDALVRAWARLWEWVKTRGEEKIALQYKLNQAVNDYQTLVEKEPKKASNLLWNNNPRLDLLQAELLGKDHGLNAQEEIFVRKSVQRRTARKRISLGVAIAVMIGLASLSLYAFYQRDIAKEQTREAIKQTEIAKKKTQEAQDSAEVAKAQRLIAISQADTARIERDNAQKAKVLADQRTVEATASALVSKGLSLFSFDNNEALTMAMQGFLTTPKPREDLAQSVMTITSNPEGRFYRTIGSHKDTITRIDFSPTGDTILTAAQDGQLILWNHDGKTLKKLRKKGTPVTDAAFSADGKFITFGTNDGEATLMDTKGQVLHSISHNSPVTSVLILQQKTETWAVSGDASGSIWKWGHVGKKERIFSWNEYEEKNEHLYKEHTGKKERILNWNEYERKNEHHYRWPIQFLQAVQDVKVYGQYLFYFATTFESRDGYAVWLNLSGEVLHVENHDALHCLTSLDYDPNRHSIIQVEFKGHISAFPVPRLSLPSEEKKKEEYFTKYITDDNTFLGLDQTGDYITMAKILPSTINYGSDWKPEILAAIGEKVIWYSANGQKKMQFLRHNGGISTMEVSPDGLHMATGGNNGKIQLWNIYNYVEFGSSEAHYTTYINGKPDIDQGVKIDWYQPKFMPLDELKPSRLFKDSIYVHPSKKWKLRLENPKTVVLSRNGLDIQSFKEPNPNGIIRSISMSKDGQFIYTSSLNGNRIGGDRLTSKRKWPNITYYWEKGLIDH